MRTYQQTMLHLVEELSNKDQCDILDLMQYHKEIIKDKTPIVFVEDPKLHLLTRLALMTAGINFIVVSTKMRSEETTLCFMDNINYSLILTDCPKKIKNSSLFRIISADLLPHEEFYHESDLCDVDHFKNYVFPAFYMTIYDVDRKPIHIDSDKFYLLYENLRENLQKNGLIGENFCFSRPDDFFIYFVCGIDTSLDILVNRNVFSLTKEDFRQRFSKNLFISYEHYKNTWRHLYSTSLQNKLLFKWFLNKILGRIIMIVLIRKFEKIYKQFNNIVVLGLITDPVLAEISEKLKNIVVYNTFGETNTMMATGISKKPGCIDIIPGSSTASISLKETRRNYSVLLNEKFTRSSNSVSNLVLRFKENHSIFGIYTESKLLFTFEDNHAKLLGHAFKNSICPAYVESIFNSFPFIKDSVLVLWKGFYILLMDVDTDMLDANNINYFFFEKIMKGEIDKINKELLLNTIQIKHFSKVLELHKRYNRLGQLDKDFLYNVIEYYVD